MKGKSGAKIRVAVIGAGASGLFAARHLSANPEVFTAVVYEQSNVVGGTWVYTESTGRDEFGLPVHSSMYRRLRTNLPKEIMGTPDFPFPDGNESFIHHTEVLNYLQKYTNHFNLLPFIKFRKRVVLVVPQRDSNKNLRWMVTVEDVKSKKQKTQEFEAVIVCNGHYCVPNVPAIPGLELFRGSQMHSHDYRTPEVFQNKRVVVLGAAASGLDVSLEVAQTAGEVILSHNWPMNLPSKLPPNVVQAPGVTSATENGFVFRDGSSCKADCILFCTGYKYSFPFLSAECNVIVENNRIHTLYKHIFHVDYPTLCFVGIPFQVCPFPLFDLQVNLIVKTLDGRVQLPNKQEMLIDAENEMRDREESGMPERHAHKLGPRQWEYLDVLAKMGGVPTIPPVLQNVYEHVHERRVFHLMDYKNDQFTLLDEENFDKVEHQSSKL